MLKRHRKVSPQPVAHDFRHRRCIATGLLFYRFCGNRNCLRARRCEGGNDPACFFPLWRHVPQHIKTQLRVTVAARSKGATVQEAAAAGAAAAAEVLREEAAQDAALQELAAPAAPPATPRARQL